MNKTLADLIDPRWRTYRDLGELARALQYLLFTAHNYRSPGRYGSSGPTETLSGHAGCVNCKGYQWHSNRDWLKTYKEHCANICDCITSALCDSDPIFVLWRKEQRIGLETQLRFPIKNHNPGDPLPEPAWELFQSLHGYRLTESINPVWKDVKMLCFPQLFIGGCGVYLGIEATSATELRRSKECASRWNTAQLTERPDPVWKTTRETFAQFFVRGVEHFKAAKPRKATP